QKVAVIKPAAVPREAGWKDDVGSNCTVEQCRKRVVEDTATVGRTGAVPCPTARGVAAHGAGVYCDEVKIDGDAAALTRTATAAVAAGAAHGELAAHSASVQRRVATAVGNAATITSSPAAAGATRRRVRVDGARGQRPLEGHDNA